MQDLTARPSRIDRARAAVAGVAPDVGARQPELVADEMNEQPPGVDLPLDAFAVDLDGDRVPLGRVGPPRHALASSIAARIARDA